jgi:hypothetical protein
MLQVHAYCKHKACELPKMLHRANHGLAGVVSFCMGVIVWASPLRIAELLVVLALSLSRWL